MSNTNDEVAEQSNVVVSNVVISDAAVSAIANMLSPHQIVFNQLNVRTISNGSFPFAPVLRQLKSRVLVDQVLQGRFQLLSADVLCINASQCLAIDGQRGVAFGLVRAKKAPVPEQREVKDLIKRLKAEGVAIIFISHNLNDIFDVSDRIFVLDRGSKAGERLIGDTNEDEVVAMMMGRVFDD